jgi:IS605 OrfB family transposase
MAHTYHVHIQRTVTILLADDADLRATLGAFRAVQQKVSPVCFNGGAPLRAVPLQRLCYETVKGTLNSQMTITALRLVAGAYASAQKSHARRGQQEAMRKARHEKKGWNYRPRPIKAIGVCQFTQTTALFLVGERGRDADFRADGTLSIWTVGGRKRLAYMVPTALRSLFDAATEVDSLTVIERNGRLIGHVALTLTVPEPRGDSEAPGAVGIDLNETNALVAVDAEGRELFISGHDTKVLNRITAHTVSRVQKKRATKKAEGKDTRGVRRALKRLSRRRARRTHDFACRAARDLMAFAPPDSVLVFEDLAVGQPEKGLTRGAALRRRLSLWQHAAITTAIKNKAERAGIAMATVNPAYTSQRCSRCGLLGVRKRHSFTCPACGHRQHADVNAAVNIRNLFVQSRLDGLPSMSPEARSSDTGKLAASAVSH